MCKYKKKLNLKKPKLSPKPPFKKQTEREGRRLRNAARKVIRV